MKPEICLIKNETPIDPSTFHFLMQYVEQQKQERILRQRVKQNADNMLVGSILVKYMILKYFGIPPEKQIISYGEYDKPYLRDDPNVHFNISHSGQYVVCAVYDRPIGIDVQEIVPYNPAVARRVFMATNIAEIEKSQNHDLAFACLWTRYEACGKLLGCGMNKAMINTVITDTYWEYLLYDNVIISLCL